MRKARLRPWALEKTGHNEVKAKDYRETFHKRDPNGHTWNQHIYAWRRLHPEYQEFARLYVAKSKLITRLGLKRLLPKWGLDKDQISRFLRKLSIEQINFIADYLMDWHQLTAGAPRTVSALLEIVPQEYSAQALAVE